MLRLKLDENSEIIRGIMGATDFVPVLRTWWEENHQGGTWPGCHQGAAQGIGRRLCLSWTGWQGRRKSLADEQAERRTAFLEEIRELLGRVPRGDAMNADENGVPPLYDGFYRWARRGAGGGQIPMHGSEKPSHTVTAAVAAGLTKPPIRFTVNGKATPRRRGLGVPDASLWVSNHTRTGWMNVVAMVCLTQRLRDLPQ
jgi:hypothetical protein